MDAAHEIGRTCLLASSHHGIRSALGELMEAEQFAIVASVSNGDAALARLRTHPVDVAVLDLALPGTSVIAIVREIGSSTPIVVYAATIDQHILRDILTAGARGVALMASKPHALMSAVSAATSRRSYVDPTLRPGLRLVE